MSSTCTYTPSSQIDLSSSHFAFSTHMNGYHPEKRPNEKLFLRPAEVKVKRWVDAAHSGLVEYYGALCNAIPYSGCSESSFMPGDEVLAVGKLMDAPNVWLIAPLSFVLPD